MIGQPLGQPIAQKAPDRHVGLRRLEDRAHRPQPPPRQHQRELDQHCRIKPRPPNTAGVIKRARRRAHVLPIDKLLDAPQLVISRHQIIQTDDLHLPRLLTRPNRKRRQRHLDSVAVTPDETSTGS
jgi:hypothetical protein